MENGSTKEIPEEGISEAEIDMTLEDSFPASDPPSWTLGVESPKKRASSPKRKEES